MTGLLLALGIVLACPAHGEESTEGARLLRSEFNPGSSARNLPPHRFSVSTSRIGLGFEGGLVAGLMPRVEYFVEERFALGGILEWTTTPGRNTTLSVGPSLTYYFWGEREISCYVGAEFVLENLLDSQNSPVTTNVPTLSTLAARLGGAVGANYHFNSVLAAGIRGGLALSSSGRIAPVFHLINLYFYL